MKYLGTTDDVTTCECCGKANLKSTVAIEMQDGSDPVYFGVTCAARALKTSAKEVKAGAKQADDAKREAEMAAKRARDEAEFAKWDAFTRKYSAARELIERIRDMGGYTTARALYRAQAA